MCLLIYLSCLLVCVHRNDSNESNVKYKKAYQKTSSVHIKVRCAESLVNVEIIEKPSTLNSI